MGMANARTLGLDVGSRTIGTAVTDELALCAHVGKTIDRRGTKLDVQSVEKLAKQYQTQHIVVGVPYEMDGSVGKRAARVMVFVEALRQAGFVVDLLDEGFSTVEARETLLEADLSRSRRREIIDSMAAQVILQRWLNSRPRAPEGE